jgi:hypothetical protein
MINVVAWWRRTHRAKRTRELTWTNWILPARAAPIKPKVPAARDLGPGGQGHVLRSARINSFTL